MKKLYSRLADDVVPVTGTDFADARIKNKRNGTLGLFIAIKGAFR